MGKRFDRRAFNNFLLDQGLLPPDQLASAVKESFIPTHQRKQACGNDVCGSGAPQGDFLRGVSRELLLLPILLRAAQGEVGGCFSRTPFTSRHGKNKIKGTPP